jgi:DNA replication protein DnaC
MVSVKNCLSKGDYDGAKAAAKTLPWGDKVQLTKILDLFYQYAPAPDPCDVCGKPIPREVNDNFDYWQRKCQHCEYETIMAEKTRRLPELLRSGGVPERYWDASMDDFPPSYKKMDLAKGYYISGSPGTGKTYLMAAMFKKIILDMKPELRLHPEESRIARRHPVYDDFRYPTGPIGRFENDFPVFISAPELLLSIKSTFGQHDGPTEHDIIGKYSGAKILFLDDLGAEYSSAWATGVMFVLINRRYNENLLTHITSNFSLEELAGRLENDRVTSRISGMCEGLKMSGRDRRLKSLVRAA